MGAIVLIGAAATSLELAGRSTSRFLVTESDQTHRIATGGTAGSYRNQVPGFEGIRGLRALIAKRKLTRRADILSASLLYSKLGCLTLVVAPALDEFDATVKRSAADFDFINTSAFGYLTKSPVVRFESTRARSLRHTRQCGGRDEGGDQSSESDGRETHIVQESDLRVRDCELEYLSLESSNQ